MQIRTLLVATVLSVAVSAQTGSYSLFGMGCPGSGTGSGPACGGSNTMGGNGFSAGNANVFAIEVAATNATRAVTGAEFYTRLTRGSAVTVNIALHKATAAGGPEVMPAATGTVTISATTTAWYAGTFSSPVVIPANEKFFVVYGDNPAGSTAHPIITDTSGTRATHYWHPPGNNPWRGPFSTQRWAVRVNCGSSNGAVPIMSNTGVPTLNQSFSLDLIQAAQNSSALFVIGGSRTTWAGANLPLDVTPFGAPNCTLYASIDLVLSQSTSATGTASLSVAVPNDAGLVGQTFYNQVLVADTTNALNLVFSNAGAGTVGR